VPEGPTLVILRDLSQSFAGERIRKATGNAKIDKARLTGQRIVALRTWGKHFLIELGGFSIRIHFLMFGRWCIDERKDIPPRLSLASRASASSAISSRAKCCSGSVCTR
jgi:endonuclease VIII